MTLPLNQLVAKEISMRGNFRFHEEFFWAAQLINENRIPLQPLLTGVYAVDNAMEAFEMASNRRQSMKVQLTF